MEKKTVQRKALLRFTSNENNETTASPNSATLKRRNLLKCLNCRVFIIDVKRWKSLQSCKRKWDTVVKAAAFYFKEWNQDTRTSVATIAMTYKGQFSETIKSPGNDIFIDLFVNFSHNDFLLYIFKDLREIKSILLWIFVECIYFFNCLFSFRICKRNIRAQNDAQNIELEQPHSVFLELKTSKTFSIFFHARILLLKSFGSF